MALSNIKIEIEKDVENRIPFDFKKNIEDILKIVPSDSIFRLEKIKVIWLSPGKKQEHAYGLYYGEREGSELPTIIVCAGNIFRDIPRIIFYIMPWVPKLLLSDTLYHEIAHHYQRISHGYKKEEWEKHAKQYSKRMKKNLLSSTRMGKVLYSLRFIISPILKCISSFLRFISKRV